MRQRNGKDFSALPFLCYSKGMTMAIQEFTIESATRIVAKALKDKRIDPAKLVKAFPARPTTPGEFLDIINWTVMMEQPATEGMYRKDGHIYKVIHAVHGSGHLYAKVLDVADRKFYVAKRGTLHTLRQVDRMSTAEAAEFGHLYGFCVRCAATLTDENSIARGMGPTCAGKI